MEQTVAEAVAAATQQQQQAAQQAQQLISQPSPPVQPVQNAQSSTIDNLTCQWQGCGERCDSAEALYDHVCERHVGRKSTNNLNLTCQWGACRTTTVKRDHITSHIRVHVPLKPHKCDFCGKAFKRPQDLKKHVKTHADDSVLMNSPQPGATARANGGNGGLGAQNGKREYPSHSPSDPEAYLVARLTAGSYYGGPNDQMNPYPNYQPQMGGPNGAAHYQPNGAQYAGYGSVSYPNNNVQDIQSMDTRRRAIEALNDFLGDIKRRAIDPSSYYDVGQRLQSNSLPLPVASGNGYNTGYNNQSNSNSYGGFNTASLIDAFSNSGYNVGGAGGGSGGGANVHGPMAQHGYSLPLPNARSKGDLQDIDRFLEQLQATVYETSNSAATAGVQQPGVHSQAVDGFGFGNSHQNYSRPSNSPPSMNSNQGYSSSGTMSSVAGSMPGMTSSASALDTPALTPASVSSYSSGHSPMSSHGRSSLSSMNGNAMYPNLPSVTGISDIGSGYGSVSYPNNNMQDIQSMDTRRRAIEALNDFLGDIKRRAIDPSAYYDVGQRLQSNSLPLPVASGNGYNTGYNNQSNSSYGGFNTASLIDAFSNSGYNVGGATGGGGGANVHGPMAQHGYSLPLPNARSKGDLQDIDRFLEQLQATVYETSNSAASAGVQQPGVHTQSVDGFNFGNSHQNYNRPSNSPPSMNSNQGYSSSVSSYSSGHSPMSSHGRSSLSSMNGNAMYPNLPSVTGISDIGSGYPTTTSAPASGLASGFDGLEGRRYSGGRLQRQAPAEDTEMADVAAEDGSRTPKQSDVQPDAKEKPADSIDPALRGEDVKSPSEASGTPAAEQHDDKRQEEWVENIRVIEALRRWIGDRLRNGEFESEQSPEHQEASQAQEGAANEMDASMMETAKMVEKLAEANAAHNAAHPPQEQQQEQQQSQNESQDVKYPTLPA